MRHPAPAGTADSTVVAVDNLSTGPTTAQCPHLEEFERCDDTVIDCRTYTWRWTAWSTCLLPDSVPGGTVEQLAGTLTPCGSGRRFRYSECVRSDGEVVAEQFCRQHLPVCIIDLAAIYSIRGVSRNALYKCTILIAITNCVRHRKSCLAPHCWMLPPGEFNSIISIALSIYSSSSSSSSSPPPPPPPPPSSSSSSSSYLFAINQSTEVKI